MACGGDVRTGAGGIVVGEAAEMMQLVHWCISACFGC